MKVEPPGEMSPVGRGRAGRAGCGGWGGGSAGGERECGWGELGLQSERRARSLAVGVLHGDLEAYGSLVEHEGTGLPNPVVGLQHDGHLERGRGGQEHFGSDLGRLHEGPLVWEPHWPHLGN